MLGRISAFHFGRCASDVRRSSRPVDPPGRVVRTAAPGVPNPGCPQPIQRYSGRIDDCMQNISEILKIVRFFLKLYRLHIGAEKTDPAVFKRIDARIGASGSEYTYELRAKIKGNWRTRRITIGPIGEESGSRSMCFKVTYDDLLVIKIPPVPIKSLAEYIENLRPSRRIAEHLSSHLVCITPEISAILKETPFFSAMGGLSSTQFEDECLKWLQNHTEFQEYIKIDDKFVFFMNLSKSFFLGR